jgi:hypothetical protein
MATLVLKQFPQLDSLSPSALGFALRRNLRKGRRPGVAGQDATAAPKEDGGRTGSSATGALHALRLDEVLTMIGASLDGLTAREAAERLRRHGANVLDRHQDRSSADKSVSAGAPDGSAAST